MARRSLLKNVFWIGGSSCSGKTTCAEILAKKYHLTLVRTDDLCFGKYMFDNPQIDSFQAIKNYKEMILSGIDSFSRTDISLSFQAFLSYCEEAFPLLFNDIELLRNDHSLIVEGAHILPKLARTAIKDSPVIFITSSKEQQRTIWKKEMHGEIPGGHPGEMESFFHSKDQKLVEETRIDFHHRISKYIEETAAESNFKNIRVNNDRSIEELVSLIEKEFHLAPA